MADTPTKAVCGYSMINGKRILAIIPARGGSKSIPRKNIINFKGKPLINWSIEASLGSKYIDNTVVTSDDDEILSVASRDNVILIKRDISLAQDLTPTEPVLLDVIEKLEMQYMFYDLIVLLQPTSPLRDSCDIDLSLEHFFEVDAEALISVYELSHNPLKSFIIDNQGFLSGIVNNEYPFMPRQSLPEVYYPNGAIYICNIRQFKNQVRLFVPNKTIAFIMSTNKSLDIDNLSDLS